MFKNSIIALFFAFSLFILSGCESDFDDNFEQDHLVVVNFTTGSLSNPSLKSTGSEQENKINKIVFFGVDNNGDVVDKITRDNPSLSGVPLTISKRVKSLHAIANPSNDMVTAIPSMNSVSDLTDLAGVFANATEPSSPFLMSGSGSVTGTTANIQFARAVAKVNITPQNGLSITSITVENTPTSVYVFPKSPLSPPTGSRTSYTTSTQLYVTENTVSNPTRFVVAGTYLNRNVSYSIELKHGGNGIDIERNKCYEVGISVKPDWDCDVTVSTSPGWSDVYADNYVVTKPNPYQNSIKILAIGNSYSRDAMGNSSAYLFHLLKQSGIGGGINDSIKVVNAFVPDCTLNMHATYAASSQAVYARQHFNQNGMVSSSGRTLYQLIKEDDWDIITLQQGSALSGFPASYNSDLTYLIDYVNTHATNPNYRLGWHMTWAYVQAFIDLNLPRTVEGYYVNYGTQRLMYEAICSTVQSEIATKAAFDFIIPTGTAIQNARWRSGEVFNSDGTHLNSDGAIVASTMWFKTITGMDITNSLNMPQEHFELLVSSINAAHALPFTSP